MCSDNKEPSSSERKVTETGIHENAPNSYPFKEGLAVQLWENRVSRQPLDFSSFKVALICNLGR